MNSNDIKSADEPQRSTDEEMAEDGRDVLTKYLDGMGTATSRIFNNRHIDDNQWEKYGLKDLKKTVLLAMKSLSTNNPERSSPCEGESVLVNRNDNVSGNP